MSNYIGIVGGVGPFASALLYKKICELVSATKEQEHPGLIMTSIPAEITDRTAFLTRKDHDNPSTSVLKHIDILVNSGCKVIGIPCNTMHALSIWSNITEGLKPRKDILLVNMVESVVQYCINQNYQKILLLSTLGTYQNQVYHEYANQYQLNLAISESTVFKIHDAIYNRDYGIKKHGKLTPGSKAILDEVLMREIEIHDCDSIILGCTELSLVKEYIEQTTSKDVICSVSILAQKLLKSYLINNSS